MIITFNSNIRYDNGVKKNLDSTILRLRKSNTISTQPNKTITIPPPYRILQILKIWHNIFIDHSTRRFNLPLVYILYLKKVIFVVHITTALSLKISLGSTALPRNAHASLRSWRYKKTEKDFPWKFNKDGKFCTFTGLENSTRS